MSKTTKHQATHYYFNGKDVVKTIFRYFNQLNFPKSDISRTNTSNIKAETMKYNINEIIDELKQEMLRCEDLIMRLVKARGNNDKEAEMRTLLDMSSQIVSNEQTFSFLIAYLKKLNENENINE